FARRVGGYAALGALIKYAERDGVRIDNVRPRVVSSTPADGSIVTSASSIALTTNEPVSSLIGVKLDAGAAGAPTVSGTAVTVPTPGLAAGAHVLAGALVDAGRTRGRVRAA